MQKVSWQCNSQCTHHDTLALLQKIYCQKWYITGSKKFTLVTRLCCFTCTRFMLGIVPTNNTANSSCIPVCLVFLLAFPHLHWTVFEKSIHAKNCLHPWNTKSVCIQVSSFLLMCVEFPSHHRQPPEVSVDHIGSPTSHQWCFFPFLLHTL